MFNDDEFLEEIKERILIYQSLGKEGYETNTTAIVNLLLEISNKTGRYGYIIKDETPMKAINTNVLQIMRFKKADKAVFEKVKKPVKNVTINDEKPIIVIECKHHSEEFENFEIDDYKQINTYMAAVDFPIGILISEFKFKIFKLQYDNGNLEIKSDKKEYKTYENILDLIEVIKKA